MLVPQMAAGRLLNRAVCVTDQTDAAYVDTWPSKMDHGSGKEGVRRG